MDSPAALPTPEPTQQAVSYQSVAVAALQDEVTALRSEISSLQTQLSQYRNQSHGQSSIQPTCSDSPRRDFRVTFFVFKVEKNISLGNIVNIFSIKADKRKLEFAGTPNSALLSSFTTFANTAYTQKHYKRRSACFEDGRKSEAPKN